MNNDPNVCKIELLLNHSHQSLILRFSWPDKIEEEQEFLSKNGEVNPENIYLWMLFHCKKIFELNDIPSKIDFIVQEPSLENNTDLIAIIQQTELILNKSLQKILEWKPYFLSQPPSEKQGKLFYNLPTFKGLEKIYQKFKVKDPDKTFLVEINPGWNNLTRRWDKSSYPTLEEIFQTLLEKKIQTIFSINMYLLQNLLSSENIFFLQVIKHLGIEYVIIDVDVYDLTERDLWAKAIFNSKTFRRFSVFPSLCSYFDREFEIKNVRYYNFLDTPNLDSGLNKIKEDLNILFISHARLPSVLENLPQILHFLSYTDPDNIFEDYQFLYFAINHLLLYSSEYSFHEKIKHFSLFSNLHLSTMSFLKYEVIANIHKEHKTLIYGDAGWKKIFPEYYQNKYLNAEETKAILSSGKSLYILFNQNFSSLEANFVFQNAINYSCPYLTFPALSHTPELRHLELLEYKNISELNDKVKSIKTLIENPNYQSSLSKIKHYTHACYEDFVKQIMDRKHTQNLYYALVQEHEKIFLTKLENYLQKNFHKVSECMDQLIQKKPNEFQIQQYSYFHKPYVQNILSGSL